MKTTILQFLLVTLPLSSVFSQVDSLDRTVFKMSPQHLTLNSLKAGVERFNKKHSASIALFVTARLANSEEAPDDREAYDGLAGELQVRRYVSPMKDRTSKRGNHFHQGIYGAVYVQGGSYSGKFKGYNRTYDPVTGAFTSQLYDYSESIGNWGLGFTIGYQRTFWGVVFLETFIGGGIQWSDPISMGLEPDDSSFDYVGITDPAYSGVLPKFGFNIGIGL